MKTTEAIEILQSELESAQMVEEWLLKGNGDADDLHDTERTIEAYKMAIRALGGATV